MGLVSQPAPYGRPAPGRQATPHAGSTTPPPAAGRGTPSPAARPLPGRRLRPAVILRHTLAWLVGLLWIVPFLGILMSALRPQAELIHGWWQLGQVTISAENFVRAWNHPTAPMGEGIRNSLLVVVPSTVLPLLIASLAAYGFLRSRARVRTPLFALIILLLAVPQQMVAIPLFRILRDLGFINSYAGLVVTHTAWALPWMIMFLRNYFATLPREVEEAALLDGAGRLQIFWHVILPLSLPGLASAAALQLTWAWNDFFMALILLYEPTRLVATQRIPLLRGQYHVDWGILTAASVLTIAVPILVFALLQRYYVRGLIGWTLK
ncbi:MAG: carbohydrate ABC transporter permease [Firmicutes bacterium]|nr:carbohydrate ABC transporter permease [Bacillota bacterium]